MLLCMTDGDNNNLVINHGPNYGPVVVQSESLRNKEPILIWLLLKVGIKNKRIKL